MSSASWLNQHCSHRWNLQQAGHTWFGRKMLRPTTPLCSTVRAVSGLLEAPFNRLSALYYLVLWTRAGLCSLLHVSMDLLSRFCSQPFQRASTCAPGSVLLPPATPAQSECCSSIPAASAQMF